MKVNFLLFEGLTQLDVTGPYEVLVRAPGFDIELVAKNIEPLRSDRGLMLLPTQSLSSAGPCDLLAIPGGPGTDDALSDPEILHFVREQARSAKYIFGICTGSLLLGAAGLLQGRRSTCHWQAIEFLHHFGAIVERRRMVVDGNIFTAGGVTSGIDMALKVVGVLSGEDVAKQIQLQIEYDPEPPFVGGTPATSEQRIVERCLQATVAKREYRAQAVRRAASSLEHMGVAP